MSTSRGVKVIGRGTWIDKIVYRIIEREKELGRSLDIIRAESGLGASGIPHIGSMADAVRSYMITLALKDLGYNSENIAFSDDMDGLRKIPEGIPGDLSDYLLWPVTSIPDPYGCHESYGEHMSTLLLDALDEAGIEYIHYSSREVYRRGLMKREIDEILRNWRRVGEIIYEESGQDKFLRVLPYFPICKECGRIYTAEAIEYNSDKMEVKYICRGTEIAGKWFDGCGYEGWARIYKDDGKLSWKGEFAARWRMLDIRFEAYGKDIADSVRINDRISREILGFEPPVHVRYEMFLDVSGRKVSKSRGNVFTPQLWFKYGSPESLILYLIKRFVGTRRISFNTVVDMMREIDYYRDIYFGRVRVDNPVKLARIKGLLEYAYKLRGVRDISVPYELVLSLAEVAPEGKEREFILKRLEKYGYSDGDEFNRIIDYAVNWIRDFGKPPRIDVEIEISEEERRAIISLAREIKSLEEGEEIQSRIFKTARTYNIPVKEFFKKLYLLIIGRDRGPRLGPLIADIGPEKVYEILINKASKYK